MSTGYRTKMTMRMYVVQPHPPRYSIKGRHRRTRRGFNVLLVYCLDLGDVEWLVCFASNLKVAAPQPGRVLISGRDSK
jgi:hypothetical protein